MSSLYASDEEIILSDDEDHGYPGTSQRDSDSESDDELQIDDEYGMTTTTTSVTRPFWAPAMPAYEAPNPQSTAEAQRESARRHADRVVLYQRFTSALMHASFNYARASTELGARHLYKDQHDIFRVLVTSAISWPIGVLITMHCFVQTIFQPEGFGRMHLDRKLEQVEQRYDRWLLANHLPEVHEVFDPPHPAASAVGLLNPALVVHANTILLDNSPLVTQDYRQQMKQGYKRLLENPDFVDETNYAIGYLISFHTSIPMFRLMYDTISSRCDRTYDAYTRLVLNPYALRVRAIVYEKVIVEQSANFLRADFVDIKVGTYQSNVVRNLEYATLKRFRWLTMEQFTTVHWILRDSFRRMLRYEAVMFTTIMDANCRLVLDGMEEFVGIIQQITNYVEAHKWLTRDIQAALAELMVLALDVVTTKLVHMRRSTEHRRAQLASTIDSYLTHYTV